MLLEERVTQRCGHLDILGLRAEDIDGALLNRVPIGLIRFDSIKSAYLSVDRDVLLVVRDVASARIAARYGILPEIKNLLFVIRRH